MKQNSQKTHAPSSTWSETVIKPMHLAAKMTRDGKTSLKPMHIAGHATKQSKNPCI